MTRVIRLHFKAIYTPFLRHVLQLQCNNLPHENCNNLPQGGIFTRSTCQSNTHAHKAVIIPSIYTTGILHFPTLSISRCSWIFFGARWIFENVKKLLGEVKIMFFGHNFFLLLYMISKFRVQSWFEMFFIRYNRELLLSSSFWENATVTTCPCNN